MKYLQGIAIVFFSSLLVSCDPQGCEYFVINNLSSDTVTINEGIENEINIGPNLSFESNQDCGIGTDGTVDYVYFRTLQKDTTQCKKEISNVQNWQTASTGKYSWKHTFVVNDSDF